MLGGAVMVTAVQMRDPLARFHSRYRFNREILPKLQSGRMIREARNRSSNINQVCRHQPPRVQIPGHPAQVHSRLVAYICIRA